MSIAFSHCYSVWIKRKSSRRKLCSSKGGKYYYCCHSRKNSQADDWITHLQWKADVTNHSSYQQSSESSPSPRILILYGSLRQGSLSKALAYEAARVLDKLGADIRIYHPESLPLQDPAMESHPKVQEFVQLYNWSQGQVWCSPVHHGSISSVLKNQLDWYTFPPSGRTVAFLQVQGGSLSGAAIHHMFTIALSMNMIIAPSYLIIPETFREFSEQGRMKPSKYREKLVEVMGVLYQLTQTISKQPSHWMASPLEQST